MRTIASYFTTAAAAPAPSVEEIRAARLRAARATPAWTEIEADLVPRARRLFVSASTDQVYRAVRGAAIFAAGSSSIVSERTPYAFTVTEEGLTFYEPLGTTWMEMLEKRAERKRNPRGKQRPTRAS
jgi:hypothetical protein